MTDNVIAFPGVTTLDIEPSKVLSSAIEQDLDSAIVIGRDKDGSLYFAASGGDAFETLWLLEIAKRELLRMGEDD